MMHDWQDVVSAIADPAAGSGLDLSAPLRIGDYNDAVPTDYRAPDLGDPTHLGILVGNTRTLWPAFTSAYRSSHELQRAANPLDSYVEASVQAAIRSVPYQIVVRFSHEPPPRRVAMQQLASVAGLAARSPSMLSVHPTYGPWIALRALVVVDVEGPSAERRAAEPRLPCAESCETCCLMALEAALGGEEPAEAYGDPGESWERWLAVRDACPVGREHRYGEAQLRYHYTKDREVLDALLR